MCSPFRNISPLRQSLSCSLLHHRREISSSIQTWSVEEKASIRRAVLAHPAFPKQPEEKLIDDLQLWASRSNVLDKKNRFLEWKFVAPRIEHLLVASEQASFRQIGLVLNGMAKMRREIMRWENSGVSEKKILFLLSQRIVTELENRQNNHRLTLRDVALITNSMAKFAFRNEILLVELLNWLDKWWTRQGGKSPPNSGSTLCIICHSLSALDCVGDGIVIRQIVDHVVAREQQALLSLDSLMLLAVVTRNRQLWSEDAQRLIDSLAELIVDPSHRVAAAKLVTPQWNRKKIPT